LLKYYVTKHYFEINYPISLWIASVSENDKDSNLLSKSYSECLKAHNTKTNVKKSDDLLDDGMRFKRQKRSVLDGEGMRFKKDPILDEEGIVFHIMLKCNNHYFHIRLFWEVFPKRIRNCYAIETKSTISWLTCKMIWHHISIWKDD